MRKSRSFAALCSGAVLSLSLCAALPLLGREAPVPLSPQVQRALDGKIKVEQRTSSFPKVDAAARSPFWPVGWKPGMKKKEEAPRISINPQALFKISSIMLGPPDLVVINGKRYESGQSIPMDAGGKTMQFQIVKVQDGGVLMRIGNGKPFPVYKQGYNPDKTQQPNP
jgi:hypothetical protein